MGRWPQKTWVEGFEGRTFLTEVEWRTFLRNAPVRYADRQLLGPRCSHCGKIGNRSNLEMAHRIPFKNGVQFLGLTPDFLNNGANLVSAHRGRCNVAVSLSFVDSIRRLREIGVNELPGFLPQYVLEKWGEILRDG